MGNNNGNGTSNGNRNRPSEPSEPENNEPPKYEDVLKDTLGGSQTSLEEPPSYNICHEHVALANNEQSQNRDEIEGAHQNLDQAVVDTSCDENYRREEAQTATGSNGSDEIVSEGSRIQREERDQVHV